MNRVTLYTTDANTPNGFRPATLDEIMNGARRALSIRIRKGTVLNSPKATADFLIAASRNGNTKFSRLCILTPDTD